MSAELVITCSGLPGFIRSVGSQLAGKCRQLECYSVSEAAQLVRMHRPECVVLDCRNAGRTQIDRAWAMTQNAPDLRCIVVVRPDELPTSSVPEEIGERVVVIQQPAGDTDLNDVAASVKDVVDRRLQPAAVTNRPESVAAVGAAAAVSQTAATRRRDSDSTQKPNHVDPPEPDPSGRSEQRQSIAERFRTRTPDLRRMLERLQVAAQHDITILLIGETGSGKTHLARLIHDTSKRLREPFVTVACGALPGDLIESELFGHTKGAFTSAHTDKDGKFIAAGRGTILLDEIDVLTPEQQVKLLRVIETGQFEPVGSNHTHHVQARIISASNLELQPLVEQGRFRPDLYYRLNTLSFRIPPLRKRLPDIEPLARYFVHLHASRHCIDVLNINQEFLDALRVYPWPGNVREMENAIRSAVIYSQNGQLTAESLPLHIVEGTAGPASDPSIARFFSSENSGTLENRIEITEKEIIEQALLDNSFSRTQTARQLGISRVTLYNKMKKYGMMQDK